MILAESQYTIYCKVASPSAAREAASTFLIRVFVYHTPHPRQAPKWLILWNGLTCGTSTYLRVRFRVIIWFKITRK